MSTNLIPIYVTLIKKISIMLATDFAFEIQYLGVVKSGDGTIKKIHLSLELFNNKTYKIIREIYLVLNDKFMMKPKQLLKYQGLAEAIPDKPFRSFIWGEKSTKELNVEFESENGEALELEENNNIKVIMIDAEKKDIKIEFEVILDSEEIRKIFSYETAGNPVTFDCYWSEVLEEKDLWQGMR